MNSAPTTKRSQGEELGCHSGKKRRVEDDAQRAYAHQDHSWSAMVPRVLSHNDYTVGWICALPLEMTAAEAMLDDIHSELSARPNDNNAYTLGSIRRHNIVVACLPCGVYGTTSATAVASQMLFSFGSITTWLLVGIGGGVPGRDHDIRLGDVVVSVPTSECAAVVQYDYGKTVAHGKFERKGNLNKPAALLLKAVAKLRADYGLRASQISTIMSEAFAKHPLVERDYAHPGQDQDVLFQPECNHAEEGQICNTCGSPNAIVRPLRGDANPRVHYGPIASGNQVMKHGGTRDKLAQQLGILCFEMEAAGLMDNFPCLVVRGICDYCDTQKHKQFQNYAALAAAAYAKELLSTMPRRTAAQTLVSQDNELKAKAEHRRVMMSSLDFDQAESRRATIKSAHLRTCKWLLQQSEYRDWLDSKKLCDNYGFLWIKGKPGTGKSTIINFALTHVERMMSKDTYSISFFFNARGGELEKSTIGMYRSLLLQLLGKLPRLQDVLDSLQPPMTSSTRHLEILKSAFCCAVENLEQERLFCFVDALDECPEDQVRDMIKFFERLAHLMSLNQIYLRVCVSSRHYPYISISIGLQLILENQEGHSDDIASYLATELKVGQSKNAQEIRAQMIKKASGIFLWIVLVARILNKEYDKGRIHALRKRLKEIPTELNELFKDILMRDGQDVEGILLCIQWILYAKRSLSREEFYFAILSGQDPQSLSAWDIEDVTPQDMDRFILSCSKGLAEMTRSKAPTVQFIHESVREYLLKEDALISLSPRFKHISKGLSHEKLKVCCYDYMRLDTSKYFVHKTTLTMASAEALALRERANEKFPFFEYAVTNVLHHADAAEESGVAQNTFLDAFPLSLWITLDNLLHRYKRSQYTQEASLLYILAERDLPSLIKLQREKHPTIHIEGERHEFPLSTALCHGRKNAIKALLMPDTKPDPRDSLELIGSQLDLEVKQILEQPPDRKGYDRRSGQSLLSYMVESGSALLVRLLLDSGIGIKTRDKSWQQPLWLAAQIGDHSLIQLLLERGADINAKYEYGQTLLIWAASKGQKEVFELLLDNGAELNGTLYERRTPLLYAADRGHEAVVRLLLERGAEIDAKDRYGKTPLIEAASNGHETVVRTLLDKGADTKLRGNDEYTPLQLTARKGHEAVVRLLLERGAEIDAKNKHGKTPLMEAASWGHEAVVRTLLDKGADTKLRDSTGYTPRQQAIKHGHKAVAKLLADWETKQRQ